MVVSSIDTATSVSEAICIEPIVEDFADEGTRLSEEIIDKRNYEELI